MPTQQGAGNTTKAMSCLSPKVWRQERASFISVLGLFTEAAPSNWTVCFILPTRRPEIVRKLLRVPVRHKLVEGDGRSYRLASSFTMKAAKNTLKANRNTRVDFVENEQSYSWLTSLPTATTLAGGEHLNDLSGSTNSAKHHQNAKKHDRDISSYI